MPDETLRQPLEGGHVPDAMELLNDTMKEFTDDIGPYIMAGLGQLCVTLPVVFILFFVIYFGIIVLLFGGLTFSAILAVLVGQVAGEGAGGAAFGLGYIGTLVVMVLGIMVISMGVGAIMAPLNASLIRRVAEHQRGGRKLDFASTFTEAKENIVSTILVGLLVSTVVLIGIMMCYLPGLIAAFMLIYAGSLVYLHKTSPVSALKISASHFMENLQFHGLFTLLYFGIALIGSYIPIAGPMFLVALHVRAHRTIFGDGEEAVLEPRMLEAT